MLGALIHDAARDNGGYPKEGVGHECGCAQKPDHADTEDDHIHRAINRRSKPQGAPLSLFKILSP
jgi:hypothetical protein